MTKTDEQQKGRITLKCGCGKEFSTHSSNRSECHTCKPKCQERHFFGVVPDGAISYNGNKVIVQVPG